MGHWYDREGNPQHFIEGKNGKSRDSTLRDAKKFGWVPGFSGINSINNKPGLTAWMQGQILDAAWLEPVPADVGRTDEEEKQLFDNWKARVKKLANERGNEARNNGLAIHDCIESWIKNRPYNEDLVKYVVMVQDAVFGAFSLNLSDLEAETTFASREGYGGMIDALNRSYKGSGLLLDWKTKDKEFDDKTKLAYDDHGAQLAAYRHGVGLNKAICANVFISPSANIRVHIWEEEELSYLYEGFLLDLERWKHKNRYECSW